jgi:DNA-binding transcriptional LysR family regulator
MLHRVEQSAVPSQAEPPELEEIVTFLRVAELGSLTEAARRLGLPKSTVSRRLGRLVEKLGVQLLHRTTRRIALTDVGEAYRERVSGAVARLDEAAEAVRERRGTPRGHLRVTAPVDVGVAYLGEVVAEFTRRYRDCTVEVVLTDRTLDLVAEGIDIALRASASMPDSSLVARRVAVMDMRLLASPAYLKRRGEPRSPADLAGHDFVLLRAAQGRGALRLQGPGGEAAAMDVRVPVSGNDLTFSLRAALEGAGIAVLPCLLAAPHARDGRLRQVLDGWIAGTAGLYVAHPGARLLSASVRVFREMVIERLAAAGDDGLVLPDAAPAPPARVAKGRARR